MHFGLKCNQNELVKKELNSPDASVSNYAGKPTESQLSRMNALEKEIDKKNVEFESIISKELKGINKKLEGKKLEPIKIMTKEEWDKKQEES